MFRDKANEITAAGEARRGHFNPDADSAHLKVYKWWVENSQAGIKPKRENFCHYWRVVVIWSPLFWLGLHLVDAVDWIISKFPKREPKAKSLKKKSFFKKHAETIKKALMGLLYVVMTVLILVAFAGLVIAFIQDPLGGAIIVGAIVISAALITAISYYIGSLVQKRRDRDYELEQKFFNGEISFAEYMGIKPKKAPGKISKFFKGVADFCHLAFQVVRVKKWKICPFVEIPD
jgi:hypothetical protein